MGSPSGSARSSCRCSTGRATIPPRAERSRIRHHRPFRRRQGNADQGARRAGSGSRGRDLGDDAPRRPGETDGVEYHFLSESEFVAQIEQGAFLEHVKYVSGKRYGTLRSEMQRVADDGRVCVLELELDGALAVQEEVPGSVTLFIAAPVEELERRLRDRATESTGEIGDRIELARNQLEQAHKFRYMVRNDDVARATGSLCAIVEQELEFAATMASS